MTTLQTVALLLGGYALSAALCTLYSSYMVRAWHRAFKTSTPMPDFAAMHMAYDTGYFGWSKHPVRDATNKDRLKCRFLDFLPLFNLCVLMTAVLGAFLATLYRWTIRFLWTNEQNFRAWLTKPCS